MGAWIWLAQKTSTLAVSLPFSVVGAGKTPPDDDDSDEDENDDHDIDDAEKTKRRRKKHAK